MSGDEADTPTIIVTGAAGSGVSSLASAIAATRNTVVSQGGAGLGLITVLGAAARSYSRALSASQAAAPNPDAAAPGLARHLLAGVLGDPPRPGTVIQAADALSDVPCLRALPTLAELVPGLVVVNLRREGVDFVASRRRALPNVDFVSHCLLWAEADAAWRRSEPELGAAAISLAREDLADDPAPAAAALSDRLGWPNEARERFVEAITSARGGKRSLAARPIDFVSVGWSLAEKTVFAELCGAGMRALGRPLDIAGALRRRPLRLHEMVAAGDLSFSGNDLAFDVAQRRGSIDVVWRGGGNEGVLIVPAVALAGRGKLKVAAGPPADGAMAGLLRIDVVDSISRLPRATAGGEVGGGRIALTTLVEATPDLVDIVFSMRAVTPGSPFGFRLYEASVTA